MNSKDDFKDALTTLRWIIERLETEGDARLSGERANWKKAAIECVEEAYGCLGRIAINDDLSDKE